TLKIQSQNDLPDIGNEDMFSLRIVAIDHYQSAPVPTLDPCYSSFRGSQILKVPVFRIFGSTPAGQKCCLHIHGAFPYILVPHDGSEDLSNLPYRMALSLDKAINISMGHAESNSQHVFKILPVSGIPFYGFHSKNHTFLKIFFYNPLIVKKAAELLQNGAVLSRPFQPYETHVPYALQFMIDNNLHGMNYIHLASFKFRRDNSKITSATHTTEDSISPLFFESVKSHESATSGNTAQNNVSPKEKQTDTSYIQPSLCIWNHSSIPEHLWLPEDVIKISCCELEVDGLSVDILNRSQLSAGGPSSNPGLCYIWEDEIARQKNKGSTLEDLLPPDSPPREHVEPSQSELFFKDILKKKLKNLEPRTKYDTPRIHENMPIATDINSQIEAAISPHECSTQVFQDVS
ncbi:hypothetical protein Anas_02875, partial [Armadillidium nasatum]